jgi:hypothetical protein
LKLDIKGSYFCSQDCFKRNWVGHILVDHLPENLILIVSRPHTRRCTRHKMVAASSRWHAPVIHDFVF